MKHIITRIDEYQMPSRMAPGLSESAEFECGEIKDGVCSGCGVALCAPCAAESYVSRVVQNAGAVDWPSAPVVFETLDEAKRCVTMHHKGDGLEELERLRELLRWHTLRKRLGPHRADEVRAMREFANILGRRMHEADNPKRKAELAEARKGVQAEIDTLLSDAHNPA